jgi:histidyl-tRNA synthetase
MTDTPDVSPRARATLPRGFADRDASDLAAAEAMIAKIGQVYALYGFEAVETPFVEYTDALGKFLPDQDRPNEGVFSFKDDDEQWLSLRYDLTAPLARHVAENYDRLPKPFRSYRAGWVFRNEKPGPGRFRQFMQFDADTVGASSPAADAEICMMAADCLEALGIKRGDYVVKVNNRKVLDGVMESIGLGGAESAGRRLTVLRAIDKLDRLGVEGVRLLLGGGRKDESGDFTKGAALERTAIEQILKIIDWTAYRDDQVSTGTPVPIDRVVSDDSEANRDVRKNLNNAAIVHSLLLSFGWNDLAWNGIQELQTISDLVESSGYSDRIRIDPSVVRGL